MKFAIFRADITSIAFKKDYYSEVKSIFQNEMSGKRENTSEMVENMFMIFLAVPTVFNIDRIKTEGLGATLRQQNKS
ncbi:CLUMA_CG016707, isoform A [Clunio marinus]|uniref:CLUMA_CG016707, isoform A n=1 Tax=Clunio marinus TaxID=568069 RepID=A0A1J1IVU5_9DIPT|nr:CLUMA_CG016707, isoform A [Clunio marinus]